MGGMHIQENKQIVDFKETPMMSLLNPYDNINVIVALYFTLKP